MTALTQPLPGRLARLPLFLSLLATAASSLVARPTLPPHFGPHMVLQREMPVPLWGTAEPGEEVRVAFAGQSLATTADSKGSWRLTLAPLSTNATPAVLSIAGNRPDGTGNAAPLLLDDVLVGEVWLCSGQSNMDMTVAKTAKYYFAGVNNEAAEVAAANHPLIRMFTGDWSLRNTPQATVAGTWRTCTPETVREFSAVGYFFARRLRQDLDVPVGIVTLTFGASTAQSWIRREAIAANPQLKPELDAFDKAVAAYVPPTEEERLAREAEVAKAKSLGIRAPKNPKADPVQDQHNPTVLFNGMIAPVVPMALRGVLWYQGESITGERSLFPVWNETLIRDWRTLWGRELPFYFVQLAGFPKHKPEVRELQAKALALPSTGMAVTIDIGDRDNVHPKNKQDVGARLALLALARTYGLKLECMGPEPAGCRVEGAALRISFAHAGTGLTTAGLPLGSLEIAGADGRFLPAQGTIEGDSLVVSNVSLQAPVSVRYAWSGLPENCSLRNSAGLPAAPFRIDAPAPR